MENPRITERLTDELARRAWFFFQVNHNDTDFGWGLDGFHGTEATYTGEGVDVIDKMIEVIDTRPRSVVMLDYGGMEHAPERVSRKNLEDLRDVYVRIYGEKVKPNVYRRIPKKAC